MTQTSDLVHLRMHSHNLLLDGACMVDKIVACAGAYGMPALAVGAGSWRCVRVD